ncbi:MAG: glycosyltransferase family 2 protein [Bacteroidota bacterium]
MDLSVIIVNYNVKYFLEQCLRSALVAGTALETEIIVIDNASTDGSQQMVREKFAASITFIENVDNPGFSKANNQGIAMAKGKYVLLLNPDTVVAEDAFQKCFDYMEAHPNTGGLGVKMIDGEGMFLPESKRSLPTPWVSFYKIFGLSSLFPNSKVFGKYHLSYLEKEENHEIEILSGAYMWMKKDLLEEIGYLDEDFFMYGEDIDLSYRILLADHTNAYLADTQIIHYKGESTKTGSLNYVKVFYQAMIIFAQKHFGGSRKQLFIAGIRLAVYFRALLAVLFRVGKTLGFPIIEGGLIYGLIYGIKSYWEHYVRYIEGGAYPPSFDWVAAPIYTLVFVSFLALAGAYKKPYQIRAIITATLSGFIAIATVSYVFPQINFSRAIVGLTSIFAMILAITLRGLINMRKGGSFFFHEKTLKRVLLIGSGEDIRRAMRLLSREIDYPINVMGWVDSQFKPSKEALGAVSDLEEILALYDVEELIFSAGSISATQIMDIMQDWREKSLSFKIIPPDCNFLIGPQETYEAKHVQTSSFNLSYKRALLSKKVFDKMSSLLLLVLFPVLFPFYKKPAKAFSAIWRIMIGKAHMVGYISTHQRGLPQIKPGILNMLYRTGTGNTSTNLDVHTLDSYYAQTYSWYLDLEIFIKGWRYVS